MRTGEGRGGMAGRDPGAVLVTGGAGYVGSHVVPALREAGYRVVVLDDLSTGRRAAVPDGVAFVEGDAGDPETAAAAIAGHGVASVVHLAASIDIAESLVDPLKYDRNNRRASARLVRACVAGGVGRFLFGSSAAVYGQPGAAPVGEDAPARPVNPYGCSKLATEGLLRETAARHGMRYAVLRYFNVAGADPLGRAGPSGEDCHLVTAACRAALGLRDGVTVFGTDYPTSDGTCVRDYIHVSDLAAIHVAALRGLENDAPDRVLNCGSGRGVSVREALAAVRAESGVVFAVRDGPRRAADPPVLVADTARVQSELHWSPRHGGFRAIVRSALAWEGARAGGTRGPEAGDGACPPRHPQGFAVLFTGLSGAGKSTLANALAAMLRARGGRRVTLLDGDVVRRRVSGDLGFSREHRQIHLRRIGVAAAGIVRDGGIAVCAQIAPYAADRRELRGTVEAAGGFVEVYVSTPLETCEARDPKGLYAKARAGLIEGFTGIDDPYEAPANSDMAIDTAGIGPELAAERIFARLQCLGCVT